MILFAHNVLGDCERSLKLLRSERNTDVWRVHWVGAVALIRAVGHVLRHRDAVEFPEFAGRIDAAFQSWKNGAEHAIFREFIDQERNNVLKEYLFSPHDLSGVRLTEDGSPGKTPIMWMKNEGGENIPYFEYDDGPYRPKMRGYLKGANSPDIYERAIEWWQIELQKIAS